MSALKEQSLDEPYGLDHEFELMAVVRCCCSPKFFGRIGHALNPVQLEQPVARVILEAAQLIGREVGHGPMSTLHVMQRLRSQHVEGKIPIEMLEEVLETFDRVEDLSQIDDESMLAELKPIVQTALRRRAIREGVKDYGRKKDLSKLVELEQKAVRVGEVDTGVGTVLGSDSRKEIADYLQLKRLSVHVEEIDNALDGGLIRGTVGLAIANSGYGKSMWLNQVTCAASQERILCAYASNELPKPVVQVRMLSGMTNVPWKEMLRGFPEKFDVAMEVLRELQETHGWIAPIIQRFPEDATTVADLEDWIKGIEDLFGCKVGLLALDYVDKMVAAVKTAAGSRDRGSYETGKVVMEGLKAMAERRGIWIWTASQGRGRDDQTQVKTRGGRAKLKKLRQGDVCDSMWKSRLAATIITINGDEDHLHTWIHVSKHTMGSTAGKTTEKMRTAFAVGRLTDGDEVFEDDADDDDVRGR